MSRRVGKWELHEEERDGTVTITKVKAQGSSKWLKPRDGQKWRNAQRDIRGQIGQDVTFATEE